ncbi:hypothetical protein Pint_25519 [Pistacia integerrima]|uniref:Uncharacterized protein n=1 Tax=Pistacia integerrima TaxID=434235 RepID=A0ACC0YDW9_9ROSI|nr:hypothetical protein Pint_25519 [Pistacia integerrima]
MEITGLLRLSILSNSLSPSLSSLCHWSKGEIYPNSPPKHEYGCKRVGRRKRRRTGAVPFKNLRHGRRLIDGRDRLLEFEQEQFRGLEPSRVRSSSSSYLFQAQ